MEQLAVVDENNQVQGFSLKEDILRRGLNYRCIQVFLFNAKDELIICRRPDSKKKFAGKFASSAMGYIRKDETYEDAAKREMMQELGVNKILKKAAEFKIEDGNSVVFQEIWKGALSDEIEPDKTEIAEYKYVSLEDLEQAMQLEPDKFTEPFITAVKAFVHARVEGVPKDKVEEQAGLKEFS